MDDGIEGLNLNLSNIRERFEQQANESSQQHQKTSTPIIDKPSINIKQTLANFDLKLQQQNSFDNSNGQTGSAGMPSTPPTMVHRSGSLMMRLKKYESVISGEKNDDDSSGDDSNPDMLDNNDNNSNINNVDSQSRTNSDVASVDLSSLKQKWESGHVNKNKDTPAHEHKEELSKVRQSLALGRNQSVKNIYEKAVKDAVSTKPLKSESVVLNFSSKANSLKEKFELGLVNDTGDSDTDEPTKLDQLRQEKMNDLSVFDEGEISAREARNLFKQIDRRLSSASQQQQSFDGTTLPQNNNETNGYQSLGSKGALINGTVTAAARRRFERQPVRCNTVADIGDNSSTSEPIEVVKCSQPGTKEDISVETTRLREKFNFFENYREEPKTPRRFEMTPPREIVANGRKYSTVTNSDSSDEEDNNGAQKNNNINGSLTNGDASCTIIRSSRKSSSGSRLANGHHINGIVVDSNNNDNADNDGIIKCSVTSKLDDVPKTDTTRRMLDKFKQLEENKNNNTNNTINNNNNTTNQPIYIGNINTNINLIKQNLLSPASVELSSKDGGRPCLKRITPPRDYTLDNDSSDDEDSSDIQQRDPNIIRCADKLDDQIQVEPEKARSLRMKFENWAANQTSLDNDDNNNNINGYDGKTGDEQQFVPSVDTTRNLKAKFEAIGREETLRPVTIPRPQARVNRFVVKDMAE